MSHRDRMKLFRETVRYREYLDDKSERWITKEEIVPTDFGLWFIGKPKILYWIALGGLTFLVYVSYIIMLPVFLMRKIFTKHLGYD